MDFLLLLTEHRIMRWLHCWQTFTDTDHVFVLIQLAGGNDGLNMVIPLDMYANYYNARTNVAIPQSKVLAAGWNRPIRASPGDDSIANNV